MDHLQHPAHYPASFTRIALFASQLRRAWGVTVVHEMARHRNVRLPHIGPPAERA
jgi:hypothetical protein